MVYTILIIKILLVICGLLLLLAFGILLTTKPPEFL